MDDEFDGMSIGDELRRRATDEVNEVRLRRVVLISNVDGDVEVKVDSNVSSDASMSIDASSIRLDR